jgi:hypothetical protein
MELIMKLVERLVAALETQAENSTRLLAVAEQSLTVNQELLQHVKAQHAVMIDGVALTTLEYASGDGNTPVGRVAAEQHAELHLPAKADAQKPNPPDMQAAMDKVEANRAEAREQLKAKQETQHVSQGVLDAAEAASKAEQVARDAEKDKAAKKITVDDVRNALKAYAKVHGNEAAMALLQKHEAVSVSAMDPSKYEAFMADVTPEAK